MIVGTEQKEKIIYAKVLYSYKPKGAGELRIHVGDTIKDVVRLKKGWCKVSETNRCKLKS